LSFVIKLVIALIIFAFVVYVLKALARINHHVRKTVREIRRLQELQPDAQPVSAEMVRCAGCGAFIAPQDAVSVTARHHAQFYCSRACLKAHAR
jgi:hypothetical protein